MYYVTLTPFLNTPGGSRVELQLHLMISDLTPAWWIDLPAANRAVGQIGLSFEVKIGNEAVPRVMEEMELVPVSKQD
jgi:hypothetical protein